MGCCNGDRSQRYLRINDVVLSDSDSDAPTPEAGSCAERPGMQADGEQRKTPAFIQVSRRNNKHGTGVSDRDRQRRASCSCCGDSIDFYDAPRGFAETCTLPGSPCVPLAQVRIADASRGGPSRSPLPLSRALRCVNSNGSSTLQPSIFSHVARRCV